MFIQFVNAEPKHATECAVHSVTSAITHCSTKPATVCAVHSVTSAITHCSTKPATVYAVHSVTSAITHCRTKLQLLQSFHFSCNRNMTYIYLSSTSFSRTFLNVKSGQYLNLNHNYILSNPSLINHNTTWCTINWAI